MWRREGAPDVILCIGTDRSTGDALGPLVGSHIMEWNWKPCAVFGTLDRPVHATNLAHFLGAHPGIEGRRVLAVDASLGMPQDVGVIHMGMGPITPGAGVAKSLPAIGRYYLTGTVNVGSSMNYSVLQNTRLAIVMQLASTIADALEKSLRP